MNSPRLREISNLITQPLEQKITETENQELLEIHLGTECVIKCMAIQTGIRKSLGK